METLNFLRPYCLFLFIPLAILMFLLIRSKRDTNIWHKICSKELMPYVLAVKARGNKLTYICMASVLSLLIVALAGPAWQQISVPLVREQSGLVIVLDLSTSMNAEDIKPGRLQRAIYKIRDLLDMRHEGQTALVVFSADPFVVTPLTDDRETIKALLPVLETKIMPTSGHQVHLSIKKATELLHQANISNGSILLVTAELSIPDLEKTIAIATQSGVKISVLGVGTEEATPIAKQYGGFVKDSQGSLVLTKLARENLTRLALSTNGIYATISPDDSDTKAFINKFKVSPYTAQQDETGFASTKWHDQGYLLVVFALPFAALIFRRGMLTSLLFLMPQLLQAFSFSDLWMTPDQQAERLFHQKEYEQAKELFRNQEWKATVNYQLGDYTAAADLFQGNQSADGLYNYGTARAQLGDFEGALEAYNQTLTLQSDHEDALYNKKVIEDFLKQQEPQDSQDKNDSESDSDKTQDQDKSQDKNQEKKSEKGQEEKSEPEKSEQGNQSDGQESSDKEQSQDREPQKKSDNEETKEQSESQQEEDQLDEKQMQDLREQYRDQMDKEMKAQEQKPPEQPPAQDLAQNNESTEEDPQRQIDERLLQRIKDDPGALLRRKFLLQHQQQQQKVQ